MVISTYRIRLYLFGLLSLVIVTGVFMPSSSNGADRHGPSAPWVLVGSGDLHLISQAIVVLDVPSGRLLYGNKPYAKLPPGPLAHMLTALIAVQDRTFDEPVLVSRRAASQSGVRLGLPYGIDVALETLVRALWYSGAGDAAMALVEYVAGSEAAFARQASSYATEYGALETRILSALGADVPGQVTTPYDMALIGRVVLGDPLLAAVAGERRARVEWDDVRRELLHINSFLWQYSGATGLKSGFSEEAGYVAAASAKRSGRHIVAVVLGAPTSEARWHDLETHLNYVFRHHANLMRDPLTDATPYDVQTGDTLLGIAAKVGVEPSVIQQWNGLEQPDRLQAGMRLWIPTQHELDESGVEIGWPK